ncbi:sensor histidine kinase [Paenibacillus swuensis]|uniref:sensor histidine kinase n=1 Tax=Paenibacillus swuensis TaxID=1178515 RepID=UPI000A49D63D|nr:histidine kinase [Paenibacillus swuensis]
MNGKFISLSSRLTLIFVAVLLPLLIILFAVGHYAKDIVLTQVAHSYQNLVDSNIRMIDKSLDDISSNIYIIVNQDENFLKFGQPGLTDADHFYAQIGLMQRNAAHQSYYHIVDMYFVYSAPNQSLFTTSMPGVSADYSESIREEVGTMFREQDMKPYLYKWNIIRLGGDHFLFRLGSDELDNGAFIGALINLNSLTKPLSGLDLGTEGRLMFVHDDGTILSANKKENLDELILPKDQLDKPDYFEVESGGKELFVVHNHSDRTPLQLAVVLPRTDLLRGLDYFQAAFTMLPMVVLVLLLLYLVMLRKLILKPIRQLLNVIRRVKTGDIDARLADTKVLDFSIINQGFNSMMDEITNLKIGVYEERIRAQKAEFKHLQTQINPHFFLNTLNIIFHLADTERKDLIKKTVSLLVNYFRFLMTSGRDSITIQQEIAHITNYLEIQKMRFQDMFDFEIRVEQELGSVLIPSLIVQPFVENGMIHGMSVRDQVFRLSIAVGMIEGDDRRFRVIIEDNGHGFTDEQVTALNDEGYQPSTAESSIGIWNVRKRLQLRYGKCETELSFRNAELGGAVVQLVLPRKDGMGENV